MSNADDEIYSQAEKVETELITDPNYVEALTSRRESDCWGGKSNCPANRVPSLLGKKIS